MDCQSTYGLSINVWTVNQCMDCQSMYGLSAGTKKSGRCGEAAVSGGSTVHHIISCHVISSFIKYLW